MTPLTPLQPLARLGCCALLVLALVGCGSLPRNGVPGELMSEATIPGMPDVRAPAGLPSAVMERDMAESFAQESASDFPATAEGVVLYPHLALSGGGANGAFGAGFLNGWSSTGKRPTFKVVTGVSTGALMAPFAFLGPSRDDALREFYTTTSSRDIFVLGALTSTIRQLLFGESIADTSPLAELIERHVDETFLREIALAHLSGRRLYIGTVDLDSQRFLIWNMGLIATSGHPDALPLFRKVMLASAAIPVAFSPVFFEVEAAGHRYDEMHVDGGVAANVFHTGGLFSARELRQKAGRGTAREDIFVIHNGQLAAATATTRRSIPDIARRTLEAAGRASVIGDLFRIYAQALREHSGYHWITIPEGINLSGNETFDPLVMQRLYDIGYEIARGGPPWNLLPPGVRGEARAMRGDAH
ncbi:MAG: patatin-like phospholipase family protein [Candidatus Accumulibacter sp.]|uniref:patatin-like phospholipase family protein n=2 Tax=Accumulibacter sp. TaxID=2053492 RepID=UPI0025F76B49|nr:patatin-like phospholipase family protein [Accumulibacter sp.]MCM8595967.1 patatin-like phospholipase family protein [Accumulibacter sp.]MCM8625206.1 patatin-like phospholipase family protein [Accumulibacter sp.]MDS4050116.1 patatin-like phospholipase family protein [Accumulibacter sp.]